MGRWIGTTGRACAAMLVAAWAGGSLAEGGGGSEAWSIVRFDGTEAYEVASATWNTYAERGVEYATFLVRAGAPEAARADPGEPAAQPFWELTVVGGETPVVLAPGTALVIPAGLDESRDEYVVDFYYAEHEVSDENRIEILSVDGDTLRARITGTAVDPHYYDGSRPRARLEVTTTFRRDPRLRRTSS